MATVAKAAPQPVPRIAPREDLNPFRIAQIQFDLAAEYLKLDAGLRQILRTPKRVLEVSIPTKMDNGQVKVFTGYRVQHNVTRGPSKGGLRYHPGVTPDEVKALQSAVGEGAPAVTKSLLIVFLLIPVRRTVARIDWPSQRRCRTRARSSEESLFMPSQIDLSCLSVKHERSFYYAATPLFLDFGVGGTFSVCDPGRTDLAK